MIAYSHMLRKDGVLFGGEGAVLIDHRLSLGLAGYGFSRTPTAPPRVDGTPREFATGYGGVLFRYHAYADFPVYGSVGVLLGGGALSVYPEQQSDGDEWEGDSDDARGYFVAQPDISLHVNVVRWLRFGLTFGYRFATAVDEYWYQASEMGGVLAGGNVQGGWL
jgi:hypothetical protein